MCGPTTQCHSKNIIKCLSIVTVLNLCPQPKSSLINRLINGRLLDA